MPARCRGFDPGDQPSQQAVSWRFWSRRSRTLKRLLSIPDGYQIVFLQGGSRLQFSMIPMNLLRGQAAPADYIVTGIMG